MINLTHFSASTIESSRSSVVSRNNLIDVEVKGFKKVDPSQLGITILPGVLSFSNEMLEVHTTYNAEVIVKNIKDSPLKFLIQYFPDIDFHSIVTHPNKSLHFCLFVLLFCSFVCKIIISHFSSFILVKLAPGQSSTIRFELSMNCTGSLGGEIQFVDEDHMKYCLLPSSANSSASRFLSAKNVALGKRLGNGSFGTVYIGTYCGDEVAIKEMKEQEKMLGEDDDPNKALDKEMLLMSQLRSPFIVQYIGTVFSPGSVFLVMELCKFGTLTSYITDNANISPKLKFLFCYDAARGFLSLILIFILFCFVFPIRSFISS